MHELSARAMQLADYGERLFFILLVVPWLIAFSVYIPTEPGLILIVVSEMLAVVFILFRRPGQMTGSAYAFSIGLLGTAFPLLVRPEPGANPSLLSSTLMLGGLILSVSGLIALNRRFGLVAANRGVQNGGPYLIVRHPIYAGYLVSQIGFLISSPTLWNFSVYGAGTVFSVLRIFEEEKFLRLDPAYRAMSERVRFRLVPGLF